MGRPLSVAVVTLVQQSCAYLLESRCVHRHITSSAHASLNHITAHAWPVAAVQQPCGDADLSAGPAVQTVCSCCYASDVRPVHVQKRVFA